MVLFSRGHFVPSVTNVTEEKKEIPRGPDGSRQGVARLLCERYVGEPLKRRVRLLPPETLATLCRVERQRVNEIFSLDFLANHPPDRVGIRDSPLRYI